jgi:hypothetical protein
MTLTAAKRNPSLYPAIRPWRDACVFARPVTSPEGTQDGLNTLEHGNGPGG